MQRVHAKKLFGLTVVLCATAAVPCTAQEGPLRQRIKERMQERLEKAPAPEANAEIGAPLTKPGDYTFKLQHDGLIRMYIVHVPEKYDPAVPTPLLLALHGGGADMARQANDEYYGIVGTADREGFVAVFANGYSRFNSGKLATWNAGKCCGAARDQKVDDVGFLRQVVANVSAQLNIDRQRVYATGMSNGAMMSYRLACEASDVFRAIAAVAGTDNTVDCKPAWPVAVLHIHAKNDSHVLFEGGAGPGNRSKEATTDYVSVPNTVARWAQLNGCAGRPQRILGKEGAYCERYSGCRENAPVQLCVTETGDHSWPGGVKKQQAEPTSQAISANEVMWEFFKRR